MLQVPQTHTRGVDGYAIFARVPANLRAGVFEIVPVDSVYVLLLVAAVVESTLSIYVLRLYLTSTLNH